jgi:pimeloyl-ACP methyl ester carboxylesterase
MVQDSTLNNLVDPPGYEPALLGDLGAVQKIGIGPQNVIFIPGLGFGGNVFSDFMTRHASEFTTYAVTLPGFGGSKAPPSPPDSVSFGEQTWTNATIRAVEELIEVEGIVDPVIIGHWLTGTQIALHLALRHPDEIKAVVLVAGSACFIAGDTTKFPAHPELAFRAMAIDQHMAPNWFKTVTRQTWDDNNFLPGDYATNPVRGLRLWREAAEPLLHVWVRYLCEFFSQDVSLMLDRLSVPTLLLKPGMEGNFVEPGNNYMRSYCHISWEASAPKNDRIRKVIIPESRVFMWFDQPDKFDNEVTAFLSDLD